MNRSKASSYVTHAASQNILLQGDRRHPDRALTASGSLLKYVIPNDNDKLCLPQIFERPSDEDVRQNWHTALKSFLKEHQTYPVNENFEVNPSLLSALCYWPLVRLTLNAKTAINRFRVSLKRVYYNDKLQGASDENACAQCILRQMSLNSWPYTLAHYLANLFSTSNELPYVTSANEWKLSSEEFWIHALLSESCRFNWELAKADTKDDTKYQSRGVVNVQATTDVQSCPHDTPTTASILMSFSPNSLCRLTW